MLTACGGQRAGFCGLARTANGFDPVRAVHGLGCGAALVADVAVETGVRDGWDCNRAMHAAYELDCRRGNEEFQVLERIPAMPHRHGPVVTLANWSFRLRTGRLQGRSGGGRWLDLGGPPFCVDQLPRPALAALRLRAITPSGGCFVVR